MKSISLSPPNDWQIKKCLALCFGLLLAALVFIELSNLGFEIPVLTQLIEFLFLALVPGLLILRILRVHNINLIESILYSVGLSIAFIMAIGVILNFALPPLGINHPIAVFPLITFITIVTILLGVAAHRRDDAFIPVRATNKSEKRKSKDLLIESYSPFLLAVLLPLLSILGVSVANTYQNNTVLIIFIFTVALIVGMIAFDKFIPRKTYPIMIVMIAISLFYQTTLFSSYIVGSDIHLEYYFAKLVSQAGYWDASIANTINSCLSIVIIAPVYSLLLGMDIVWLFKIVYPILFCLAPLALYRVFRFQMKPRYAFLSTFFFMSLPMFFMDMTQLVRQQVSELFFVLVILLMVERRLTTAQRTILVVIFGFGVIVSYYGLGTGYAIGYITLGMILLLCIKSKWVRNLWQWIIGKSNSLPDDLGSAGAFNKKELAIIIGVSVVFMFAYYGTVASGAGLAGFHTASGIAQNTGEQVGTGFGFMDPRSKEPLVQTAVGLDFPLASIIGKLWRILQYLVELFLVVGFGRLIFRPTTLGKLKSEYIAMVIVSALILLGIFILPTWSYGMGVTRIWEITLLLISPLFIFGGETIALGVAKLSSALRKGFTSARTRLSYQTFIWVPVVVILIPYFIFNSGVIFELSRSRITNFIDSPYSIALSGNRLDLNTVFTIQDLDAAHWLCNVPISDEPVLTDYNSSKLFVNRFDFPCKIVGISPDGVEANSAEYVYLRTWNWRNRQVTFATGYATRRSISFDELPWWRQITETANRIYYNGGAQILMIRDSNP